MIPLQKVKNIILRHNSLEKDLSSGNVEPKLLAIKSKEYSNLGSIVSIAKEYLNFEVVKKDLEHEKLIRKDYKYDLMIPIKYNFKSPITGKGGCIFIHLTKNYKPTAGCIGLKKKDFLVMLKLINKNTKIKIF